MSRATPRMRVFARRLIAYESRAKRSARPNPSGTFPVCEKLRPHLATLVGKAGFRALLARALALAGAEIPALRAVRVNADGALQGVEKLVSQLDPDQLAEGRVVLVAQLLGLLEAFIGEKLTLRLLGEIWPKVPLHDLDGGRGGTNEKKK